MSELRARVCLCLCATCNLAHQVKRNLPGRADAYSAEVVAKGGIDVVLTAMRRHKDVAAVAEKSCAVLQRIAYAGEWSAVVSECVQLV